jgi:hypothetical protein
VDAFLARALADPLLDPLRLLAQLAEARESLTWTRLERDQARDQLAEAHTSTSWRITAPLRALRKRLPARTSTRGPER